MKDAYGVIGVDTITNFKNPKRIRLTVACVYMDSYYKSDDRGLVEAARELLDARNIELDVLPGYSNKTSWNTIPDSSRLIKDSQEDYKAVYKAAKARIRQMGCSFVIPLPIVFGQFECGGYAIAPNVKGEPTRLCMISPEGNSDKLDLLHEIGHAAGLGHELAESSGRSFMHVANPRSLIYKYQVDAFAHAPFAVG